MKKVVVLCLAVILTASASGQNSIGRNANISLFSGYLFKQQNTNNNAFYYGAYADYPIFKDQKWNLGLWGVGNRSDYNENLTQYKSSVSEMALGLNTGLYLRSESTYSFYFGLAAGYKFSQETGDVSKTDYSSSGVQNDQMLNASGNFNYFNDKSSFPRTQLNITYQKVFNSEKTMSEDQETKMVVDSWKKGYVSIGVKQSLVDIRLNKIGELLAEPKIGATYYHYDDGYPEAYGFSGEIALKKKYHDDLIFLNCEYKTYPGKKAEYVIWSLSVNILRLFE